MQAILTKFIPATMNRPNRIKAYCPAGSITLCSDNIPFASHDERAHRIAAIKLSEKLGWQDRPMINGEMPDGNKCFVFLPKQLVDLIDCPTLKEVIEIYYK